MNDEDIIMWADGTWCFRHELQWYTHMSDDYTVDAFDSPKWRQIVSAIEQD